MRAEAGPSGWPEAQNNLAQELTIKIEGMWCTACAWVIEALLCSMKGVLEARVFSSPTWRRSNTFPTWLFPARS